MEDMIDTGTAFKELAQLLGNSQQPLSVNNFYSRPSIAKYYETDKQGVLFWNWECKIGIRGVRNDSFAVKTNNFGIKQIDNFLKRYFWDNKDHVVTPSGKKFYQIINSYNALLKARIPKLVKKFNAHKDKSIADTKAVFDELADAMSTPDHPLHAVNFYARPSVDRFYENDKHGFWIWECKIGLKDDSFAVRINDYGVKDRAEIMNDSFGNASGRRVYQILNFYKHYLRKRMRPLVKTLNTKYRNPLG